MGGKKKNKGQQQQQKPAEKVQPKADDKKDEPKVQEANKEDVETKNETQTENKQTNDMKQENEQQKEEEPAQKNETEPAEEAVDPALLEQQEQRLVNLIIKDLNGREIKLKMLQYELILELREFLSEHVYTCFFTNYYLEHAGARLSEYSDLSGMDLDADPYIYMRPQLYSENSARAHIKRVNEILTTPCLLNAQQNISKEEEHLNKLWEEGKANDLSEEELTRQQEEYVQEITAKQDEKQRHMYEQFMGIVQKDQAVDHARVPPKEPVLDGSEPVQGIQHHLLDLSQSTIEKSIKKQLKNSQYTKCVESIQYSSFNPVPDHRRLAGDLFYLTVKTLDAGERCVTCCVNGFYLNDSIERAHFSPTPSTRAYGDSGKVNKAFSYTLVGCINQLSAQFGKNLEIYINQILNTEQYFLTQPPLKVHHWTLEDDDDKKGSKVCTQSKLSEVVNPLFGLDPKGIRDWNEEYQVVKNFPKDTMAQRAQRDRAIAKIYNDFLNAATEGAIAIIKGSISPLNPTEQKKSQVFVYNLIFFSFAIDSFDNFKDLTQSEQNPSWTQANHDLSGLRQLQALEVDGLHYVATAIINYRGHRIIAQSIIPGILNNSELSSLAEYGTVDEQKTIQSHPQFHELMQKVAAKLGVQVNKILDAEGKATEIAGCVEIKGIRGTDKRCYVVDLQGMTPRDANYLGDEYHTCLIRHELVNIYNREKSINHAKEKMKEADKLLEEEKEKRAPKVEEGKEMTEEQKKEYQELIIELNERRQENFQKFVKDLDKEVFNTNVFKNIKLAMSEDEVKKEEDKVQELSKFLKETAVAKLIEAFEKGENVPTDSETLSEFFHSNGVNIRYLGYIADQVEGKNMPQAQYSLEREVVLRCLKHILNQQIRDFPSDELLADLLCHILNCLFAPSDLISKLEDGSITFEPETMQDGCVASVQEGDKIIKARTKASSAEIEKRQVSKKEKKRQKKQEALESARGEKLDRNNQDKPEAEDEEANSAALQKSKDDTETVDIEELLFKQNHIDFTFEANELFLDAKISFGLHSQEVKDHFSLKPSEIYAQIVKLAEQRYSYTKLPDTIMKLKCLSTPANKFSVIRDICQCIGLKLNMHHDRELILENDSMKLRQLVSAKLQHQRNASNQKSSQKKKPVSTQQSLQLVSNEELYKYQNMPFQRSMISDFYPIVKHLDHQNQDASQMVQEANAASNDGLFEKAFDLYNQVVNLLLQVTGAMNPEVAKCITKMANIQYKMGDFLQAIELQTKSIIIEEKIHGYDAHQLAYSYSNLGLYYHQCRYWSKGFEYLNRARNILQVVSGDGHPDTTSIILNLGLMYQDCDQFAAAIECFTDCLYRNISLYGDTHNQVVQCYQAIAQAYYYQENFRMALDYQEKHHELLKKLVPADSPYLSHSEKQLRQFKELSIRQEKAKQAEKAGQRAIGSNKPAKMSQKERIMLEQRQRLEMQQRQQADPKQARRKYLQRQQAKGGFLDVLAERYRQQQFQEMIARMHREQQKAAAAQDAAQVHQQQSPPQPGQPEQPEAQKTEAAVNGSGKIKGETLLARVAREQMMQAQQQTAPQPAQAQSSAAQAQSNDQGELSARGDDADANANKKKRKKTAKK